MIYRLFWVEKSKKATINPINKKITNVLYMLSRVKSWGNQKRSAENIKNQNCEGITFQLEKDDRKRLEKNNVAIDLNILYAKKVFKHIFLVL